MIVPFGSIVLVLGLGAFVLLFRLDTPSLHPDEPLYMDVGRRYVQGDLALNWEHPPLGKQILGISQTWFGEGVTSARAAAAAASLVTGVVLITFGRRVAGLPVGLVAAGLWFLLPSPSSAGSALATTLLERYALLDVFMAMFVALALFLGWRWAETGNWVWAVLAGVALGLGVASKAPAVLTLPVIVVLGLSRRGLARRAVLQAGALVAISGAVALLPYAPFGHQADDAIRFMFTFQLDHGRTGHPVFVRGSVYRHPPWWAHLWWQARTLGGLGMASLAALIVLAVALARRAAVLYLVAAAAVPFAYLSLLAGFSLVHHSLAWRAPLVLLAAVAFVEMVRRGWRWRMMGAILAVPLVVSAAGTLVDVASLRQSDYAAAADFLEARGFGDQRVAVAGYSLVLQTYLPRSRIVGPAYATVVDAAVVDPRVALRYELPTAAAEAEAGRGRFSVHRFDGLLVYVADI
jgi:4-amino-4-deoxy-L-arabinose transferase-like glycosyltransferase